MYSEAFVKGGKAATPKPSPWQRGAVRTTACAAGHELSTLIVCRELARSSGANGTDYEPDWL
jgi:hypothetical protein